MCIDIDTKRDKDWWLEEYQKRINRLTTLLAEHQEVKEGHDRLVRELDVVVNGDATAKQASLCNLVFQIKYLLAAVKVAIKAVKSKHTKYVVLPNFGIAVIDKNELFAIEQQLAASKQECERLKAEVQSLQCPSYCAREADIRKQAVGEILIYLTLNAIISDDGTVYKDLTNKFGLEG